MTDLMIRMQMPVENAPAVVMMLASEIIEAGSFVNLWHDGTSIRVRNAIALDADRIADGFILQRAITGANCRVYFDGLNDKLTGLIIGSRYYLSDADPGGMITNVPAPMAQYLGRAVNFSMLVFQRGDAMGLGSDGSYSLFIQDGAPAAPPAKYLWIKTNNGAAGNFSLLFEDGT